MPEPFYAPWQITGNTGANQAPTYSGQSSGATSFSPFQNQFGTVTGTDAQGNFVYAGNNNSQSSGPGQTAANYGVGTSDPVRAQENKTRTDVGRMYAEYLGSQNNNNTAGTGNRGSSGSGGGTQAPSLNPLQQSIADYQNLNSQNGSSIDDSRRTLQDQFNNSKSGIESSYAPQFTDLAQKQKSQTAFTTTSLARIGGYLGGSANNMGALQNLERLQQIEVSSLQSKMNAEIAQARTEMLKGSMELAKESRDRAMAIQDAINKRKDEFFKESMDLIANERAQTKTSQETYKFQSENLVPFIASHLGEDETANEQMIQETAQAYGMDPLMLKANIEDYNTKQKLDKLKEYTPDIKNYNFAVDSGFKGTFMDYQRWEENMKAAASKAGSGTGGSGTVAGISAGDPIYFATAHLGGDKQEQRYIEQYASMKKSDPEAAQAYLNRLVYSGLPAAQKEKFMEYGTAIVGGQRGLKLVNDFKGREFGPYKAAIESGKPFVELQKDQKYVELVSQIQRAQAQVRRAFFGTAVTDGEKASADGFLIDEHKDDLATAETKLKGLVQLANDHINLAFSVGLGDYSSVGGPTNPGTNTGMNNGGGTQAPTTGMLSGKPVTVGQTITRSSDKTKWKVTGVDGSGKAIVEQIK